MPITEAMEAIYEMQADVLRVLANPRRLEMLHLLADGPMEVGRIALRMGISQPNASQHLALLRSSGLVEVERDGREVRYQLTDPQVMVACNVMRGFLQRRLSHLSTVAIRADMGTPAGVEA
jgi:ArsR family transcriptional regulator, zinc-responsive transcriptional repressor